MNTCFYVEVSVSGDLTNDLVFLYSIIMAVTIWWEGGAPYARSTSCQKHLISSAAANNLLLFGKLTKINGRKSTSNSMSKANRQPENLNKWQDHFKNLLRNVPDILKVEQIIRHPLDIKLVNYRCRTCNGSKKHQK